MLIKGTGKTRRKLIYLLLFRFFSLGHKIYFFQVSNKTDQLFAALNQPLLILDIQNMNLGRMLCDPVVALGELVESVID